MMKKAIASPRASLRLIHTEAVHAAIDGPSEKHEYW
jgi:hypothetical protein